MLFDLLIWGPWSVLILLPGIVLGIYAQSKVSSTFSKYSKIHAQSGIPASFVAREMLSKANINDVTLERVRGSLTDHYDPKASVVRLSDTVFDSSSVASIGVAAHEIGHVLQKKKGYVPMKIRALLIPVINFGTKMFLPLLLIGLLIELFANTVTGASSLLINLGVIMYGASTLLSLVTLPVEINASRRAKQMLVADGILTKEETNQAGKVLDAAALTYFASFVTSLLYFLRFLLIINRMRNN